jgi:nitrile hydratase subunit beta
MRYQTHADLGGQFGHGVVTPEAEGELFHARWEPQALALTVLMGGTGAWNIDMSRAARETLPDYAQRSYYSIWFAGLEKLLAERGLVSADEITAGHAIVASPPLPRLMKAADLAAALSRGSPTSRPATTAARFKVGDAVRTMASRPAHHTRLPAYAMGKGGIVERVHGVHVFADRHAQGLGEAAQWLYTVAFDGAELWGPDAAPGIRVSVDAWDAYLEPA